MTEQKPQHRAHPNPVDEGWTGFVDRPEWKISYMNSVVQCLYHTPYLRDFFLSHRFENELNLPVPKNGDFGTTSTSGQTPLSEQQIQREGSVERTGEQLPLKQRLAMQMQSYPRYSLVRDTVQGSLQQSGQSSSSDRPPQLRVGRPSTSHDPQIGSRALHIGAIILMMWSSKFSSLRLTYFREDFLKYEGVNWKGWGLGNQQKAIDFFENLMHLMHNDLKDENTNTSIIKSIFSSDVLNEGHCDKCFQMTMPKRHQYSITLIYRSGNYNLWGWPTRTYFQEECENLNTDNQVCKGEVKSNIQWLLTIPRVLVIEIQRFDEQDNRIDVPYEINAEISINELVHEDIRKTFAKTEDGQEYEVLYALYAVIHHSGGHTLRDGNYITFVQYITDVSQVGTSNGEWRKYQDNKVTKSNKDEAIDGNDAQRDVYALFYLSVEDPWFYDEEKTGEQKGLGVQKESEVQVFEVQEFEVQEGPQIELGIDDEERYDDEERDDDELDDYPVYQ